MDRQITPVAFFDSLSVAHKLDNFLDGFNHDEIQLFSYFSAILFHYDGNIATDWKYSFVTSPNGYPHSIDLDEAITSHIRNGLFEEGKAFLSVTGRGVDEYNKFKNFNLFSSRERYIDAATSTSLLIPYQEARAALLEDPDLNNFSTVDNQDWIKFNNTKLKQITKEIGAPIDDLVLPAISWVNFLLKNTDEGDLMNE